MPKGSNWSEAEVRDVVEDYFSMLRLELSGQTFNKSKRRKALLERLDGRSEGAIERKHQNISAVLHEMDCPSVFGYKPLSNYQSLLREVVVDRLFHDNQLDETARRAAALPAEPVPDEAEISGLVVPCPFKSIGGTGIREAPLHPTSFTAQNSKDYLQIEARNRALGAAGETLVARYERERLKSLGLTKLSKAVEHVAKTRGDGLGFDVLSFSPEGKERYLEVKTTAHNVYTPFWLSRNELAFSQVQDKQFELVRVFNFRRRPQAFIVPGRVDASFALDPANYRASFAE